MTGFIQVPSEAIERLRYECNAGTGSGVIERAHDLIAAVDSAERPTEDEPKDTNKLCECGHVQGWHDPANMQTGMCLWPNGWPDKRECECDGFAPRSAATEQEDDEPRFQDHHANCGKHIYGDEFVCYGACLDDTLKRRDDEFHPVDTSDNNVACPTCGIKGWKITNPGIWTLNCPTCGAVTVEVPKEPTPTTPRVARSVDDLRVGMVVAIHVTATDWWKVGPVVTGMGGLVVDHRDGQTAPFHNGGRFNKEVFILADPPAPPAADWLVPADTMEALREALDNLRNYSAFRGTAMDKGIIAARAVLDAAREVEHE